MHADGIRHADVAEGERVLNEIIHERQQSLEAIGHAKVDVKAQEWARGQGLKGQTAAAGLRSVFVGGSSGGVLAGALAESRVRKGERKGRHIVP
jgi:hypothetical protein